MATATLWILIAVSAGYGHFGTPTVIAKFASAESCTLAESRIPAKALAINTYCLRADGVLTGKE